MVHLSTLNMYPRQVFSAALLATLLLALQPAQAQPSAADKATIEACLEREGASLGDKCIGLVADPCIAAANGESDKAQACAARELAVWQAEMAAALKRVRAGGFREIGRDTDQAQQAWTASVNALCPALDRIDPGMLPGGATYCRMHETASRALMLRRLGEAVNEH